MNRFVCIFVLIITSGPSVKFVDRKVLFPPTPVAYATDRSKAVVWCDS